MTVQNIENLSVSMDKRDTVNSPLVVLRRGDKDGTLLNVTIEDELNAVDLEGCRVWLEMLLPNDNIYRTTPVEVMESTNQVSVTVDEDLSAISVGNVKNAYFRILDTDGKCSSTASFTVKVIDGVDPDVPSLNERIEQARDEVYSEQQEIIVSLRNDLDDANNQIQDHISTEESLRIELEDTRTDLENVSNDLADAKADLENASNDLEDTKSRLEDATNEIETLKSELESVGPKLPQRYLLVFQKNGDSATSSSNNSSAGLDLFSGSERVWYKGQNTIRCYDLYSRVNPEDYSENAAPVSATPYGLSLRWLAYNNTIELGSFTVMYSPKRKMWVLRHSAQQKSSAVSYQPRDLVGRALLDGTRLADGYNDRFVYFNSGGSYTSLNEITVDPNGVFTYEIHKYNNYSVVADVELSFTFTDDPGSYTPISTASW